MEPAVLLHVGHAKSLIEGIRAVIVAGGGNGGLTAVIPTHVYNVPPGDIVTRPINRV